MEVFLASRRKRQLSVYQPNKNDSWYWDINRQKDLQESEDFPKFLYIMFVSINNFAKDPVFGLTLYDSPDFRWVNVVEQYEPQLFLSNKINAFQKTGLNLLKSRPVARLSRRSQVVPNGVSVFLWKWVELKECVGTSWNKRDQLQFRTNLHDCSHHTYSQKQNKAQLETLQKQIQSCVKSNYRPEKIKTVLES